MFISEADLDNYSNRFRMSAQPLVGQRRASNRNAPRSNRTVPSEDLSLT